MAWDGKTVGAWKEELEGADAVINLAGRSVNCRYNIDNLNEMMSSRVESVRAIGSAISECTNPPNVWLQSSTATIYAHRFDTPNDEETGILGGDEPGAPFTWNASIKIAKAWEAALDEFDLPSTRKVALRSAMTMSADSGSVFFVFASLARKGLGGRLGSGKQYVSWIHQTDFARAISFLIDREDMSGAVNLCSPNPLPQAVFMAILRQAVGAKFGFPTPEFLVELGTWAMRTESELVLKSRRVVPKRLLAAGFTFDYPGWKEAAKDLSKLLYFRGQV